MHKKFLTIYDNDTFPADLDKYSEIESIEISSSKIKTIPEEIKNFKKLKSFKIEDNNQFDFYKIFNILKYNKSLKTLFIDGYKDSDLPSNLKELQSLEEVIIGGGLKQFPEVLFSLKNLKFISLSYNLIKEVPDDIKSLKNLETLAVQNSELMRLPKKMNGLNHLKFCVFDNCKKINHKNLLKSLSYVDSIIVLSLSFCDIGFIPREVTHLRNLEIIRFDGNQIKVLPKFLADLKNIKEVWLTDNEISDIEVLFKMNKIEKLYLDYNNIKKFPKDLSNFKKSLQYVQINNNPIDSAEIMRIKKEIPNIEISFGNSNKTDVKDLEIK